MSNVHTFPVKKTPGRRRVRPVRNAPLAEVLSIAPSPNPEPKMSTEERLAIITDHTYALATALLSAIQTARAVMELSKEQRK